MSAPPAPLGEIVSTPDEPLRAADARCADGRPIRGRRQHHRQPGDVGAARHNPDGLPFGVHFLGRFGDEATLLRLAAQLEQARPWAQALPSVS